MSHKTFFNKSEPFVEGFLSTFDLFGSHTFTKEDFDKLTLQKSEIDIKENDLEAVARDFWNAFDQYEEENKTIR